MAALHACPTLSKRKNSWLEEKKNDVDNAFGGRGFYDRIKDIGLVLGPTRVIRAYDARIASTHNVKHAHEGWQRNHARLRPTGRLATGASPTQVAVGATHSGNPVVFILHMLITASQTEPHAHRRQ